MLTKRYISRLKDYFYFSDFSMGFLSYFSHSTTFPSLFSIVKTLLDEVFDGEIIFHLGMTLYRVFFSFVIAMILGTGIECSWEIIKNLTSFFDSWNILFLNIPALVLIILSYIWFGLTEVAAIIAVSLNKYLML